MPFAYPARGAIQRQIIARVAAGETVKAICAEAEMPCADSVQVWRRADPGFAAELAMARRRGGWRRVYGFDEAVAAAFLARVAAGERITDLLARPGMPSQAAYAYWRRTNVGFQETLWRLRGARYGRQSWTGHGRFRAWDEAVADRILLAVMRGAVLRKLLSSDPAFPCLAVLERWRREQPVWDRALVMAMAAGRRARWRGSPELTDEIWRRIVMGGSLRSLGAEAGARERGMPSAGTLYAWVKRVAGVRGRGGERLPLARGIPERPDDRHLPAQRPLWAGGDQARGRAIAAAGQPAFNAAGVEAGEGGAGRALARRSPKPGPALPQSTLQRAGRSVTT